MNDKNIKYIDLQYFGSIETYLTLIECNRACFFPNQRYRKAAHSNRMVLSGANGPLLLSIPLVGGRDKKQLLQAVEIAYTEPWQKNHWKGIVSSYRKAPWFEEYETELREVYQQQEQFLINWNLRTMQWALEKLKLKIDIMAEYKEDTGGTLSQNLWPLTKKPNYIFPAHQQVFSDRFGFLPNLCILDLILSEGPKAVNYLSRIRRL